MLADEFRRVIEGSPRMELDGIAKAMWAACADRRITEAEATELSDLIQARRTVPAAVQAPRKNQGSRPKTPESLTRRRRLATSGRLPPALASHFSLGEMAVMAVVSMEVIRDGKCTLCLDRIAACAGVSRTTAKNALRHAERLRLVTIEERRQTFWRNLTNVVRIVSPEWQAWNRLAPRPYHLRGGVKSVTGTSNLNREDLKNRSKRPPEGCRRRGREPGSGAPSGSHAPGSADTGR